MWFHHPFRQYEDNDIARQFQAIAASYFASLRGFSSHRSGGPFSAFLGGGEKIGCFLFPLSLTSLHFTGWGRFPLAFGFCCFGGFFAAFELYLSRGTFCDPGSMSRTIDERLEQELPWKMEVNDFKGLKALCTSQPSSSVLFSNPMGLAFMTYPLWLLLWLLSTLNSLFN